jgi:pimeloyl-ACP methyl ester carboxylesterase
MRPCSASSPALPPPDPGLTDGDLASVTAPVMLLHGREDRVVPADDGIRMAALLPHADLHLLGGTGHWLQIERAATVNALITDFLIRCPA